MQRDDTVIARLQAHRGARAVGLDLAAHNLERVDHDVADTIDLRSRHAFAREVLVGVGRWRPQYVADRVGDQAVYLFGHAPVAAAQSSLEVHHRDPELGA